MNKIDKFAVAGLLLIAGGLSAAVAEQMPKVFRDAPAQNGQWRVELLSFDGGSGGANAAGMPKSISMCLDSLMDMAKKHEGQPGPVLAGARSSKTATSARFTRPPAKAAFTAAPSPAKGRVLF